MIDMHNTPADIQQATKTRFSGCSPWTRRSQSVLGQHVHGVDPLWLASPNHMKIFFNNKRVAAKETDHCTDYQPNH
jgi:Domain of unknown function (DUF5078)